MTKAQLQPSPVAKKQVTTRKLENNQISKKKSRGGRNHVKTGAGHGGARKGAGRKEGAASRRTREIIDKLFSEGGVTPLSYLLSVMRETPDDVEKQFESGTIDHVEYTVKMQGITERRDRAAVSAAPYMHPRISAITANVNTEGHDYWIMLMEDQNL